MSTQEEKERLEQQLAEQQKQLAALQPPSLKDSKDATQPPFTTDTSLPASRHPSLQTPDASTKLAELRGAKHRLELKHKGLEIELGGKSLFAYFHYDCENGDCPKDFD